MSYDYALEYGTDLVAALEASAEFLVAAAAKDRFLLEEGALCEEAALEWAITQSLLDLGFVRSWKKNELASDSASDSDVQAFLHQAANGAACADTELSCTALALPREYGGTAPSRDPSLARCHHPAPCLIPPKLAIKKRANHHRP